MRLIVVLQSKKPYLFYPFSTMHRLSKTEWSVNEILLPPYCVDVNEVSFTQICV